MRLLTENPLAALVAAGCFALDEDREGDLIDMLAQALLPYVTVRSIGDSLNMETLRIVRRAEEASRRIPGRPLSLSELCREAEVSRAWLHRCFHEVYGLSPVQCARRWRMSAARERLLVRDRDGILVKEVALQYGFSHSGRFGSEFRAVFGEYPSQTLLRGLQGDNARFLLL